MELLNEKQYLQKIQAIENNIEILKRKLEKQNQPIFVELVGTPKSGKTTLKNAIMTSFSNKGIDIITRQETAEYNPIEKNADTYGMWMVLELFKNLSEDLAKNKGQIIIYDRGILDRIPWMQYDIQKGNLSKEDFKKIMPVYDMQMYKKYRPISLIFETSPELSIQRKGKPGVFVNEKSIEQYNSFLNRDIPLIKSYSSYSNVIKTDEYQGNLQQFIIDCTEKIIWAIERNIELTEISKEK